MTRADAKFALAIVGTLVWECSVVVVMVTWPLQFFLTCALITPVFVLSVQRWLRSLN